MIYLVRHASAGQRDERNPDDDARGLDPRGVAQAARLVELFDGTPLSRVVSSPLSRCLQTIGPLARSSDLKVEPDADFAEMTDPLIAWSGLTRLADAADGPEGDGGVVVCSHGDTIPDLLRIATLRGMRIRGRSGCAKGSIWSLSGWDGTTFRTATYSRGAADLT